MRPILSERTRRQAIEGEGGTVQLDDSTMKIGAGWCEGCGDHHECTLWVELRNSSKLLICSLVDKCYRDTPMILSKERSVINSNHR